MKYTVYRTQITPKQTRDFLPVLERLLVPKDQESLARFRFLLTFDFSADRVARSLAGRALELPLHEPPVVERFVEHVLADVRDRRVMLTDCRSLRDARRGRRVQSDRIRFPSGRRVFRTSQDGARARGDHEYLQTENTREIQLDHSLFVPAVFFFISNYIRLSA